MSIRINEGTVRLLTKEERIKTNEQYYYVVQTPFIVTIDGKQLTVPEGFLTDGASGGPDVTPAAWVCHDYLYAGGKFDNDEAPSRAEADKLMYDILMTHLMYRYARTFWWLSKMNPLWSFSRAWIYSHTRGIQLLQNYE